MREVLANAFVPGRAALPPEEQAMIERRARLLGPAYRLFYERPLHIVRGEGVQLWDAEGNAWLDAYNNVPGVGHCHPRVVEAIATQAATLNTHTRYLHDKILDLAERLLATMPAPLAHMMFTCTGSEANDLACRIASAATGGDGFIVTRWAYHGATEAITRLSPSFGDGVEPGPKVRWIPAPDTYRLGAAAGEAFAAAVRAAAVELRASGVRPAALLVDTAFTSDGNYVDPPGFLAPAVDAIHAEGGLFIADEVQPGFGRTGQMWGFSRHGVAPDLVTMGKPMGNGHPIAGLAVSHEALAAFADKVRYFNTFGGNPVSCAAALAVLDVLRDEGLMERAAAVGERLKSGFLALSREHEGVGDVRGAGLAFAVELVRDRATREPDPALARALVRGLYERRVLISLSGEAQNVLKIRPPLCFGPEHADRLLEAVREVLAGR